MKTLKEENELVIGIQNTSHKEKFGITLEDEDTRICESSKVYAMFLQILILCYQI